MLPKDVSRQLVRSVMQKLRISFVCLKLFEIVDEGGMLDKVVFVALNQDRLPKFGPEDINLCSIAGKQDSIELSISALQQRVDDVSAVSTNSDLSGYKFNKEEFAGFWDKVHQHIDAVDAKLMHQVDSHQTCLRYTE